MTIDANLFAHIENDSSLAGTFQLQGNRFSRTVEYLTNYLSSNSHNKASVPPEYAELFNQLQYLIDTEQKLEAMHHDSDSSAQQVDDLARKIAEDVMNMKEDSKILIPGGWHSSNGGHAMVYEFSPHADGFKFSAVNAGAGLNYHAKKSNKEKELYNPTKSWHVPSVTSAKSKEELIRFIERLLKARLPVSKQERNKPIDEKVLYEEIFPTISYIKGSEIDASKDIPKHAYTGGQLSGTCSQRCIHQMIKILTSTEKKYQEFIFDFKQHALYEYADACLQKQQPYNPAVAHQIRLAIENNLKILNTPGLFSDQRIEKELKNISALEIKLKTTPFDIPKQAVNAPKDVFSLQVYTGKSISPKVQLDQQYKGQKLASPINLGDGKDLLKNLNEAIANINLITDPAAQYNYLEHLILQLPLIPNNPNFYREFADMSDFGLLKNRLTDIQTLLLNLQNSWLKKEQIPAMNLMLLSIISLQIDVHDMSSLNNNTPSFKPFSDAMMKSMLGNQERNPFYATNNPIIDQLLQELHSRNNNASYQNLTQYHLFLKQLVESEPVLNEELSLLYDKKFSTNAGELHQEIRKSGLKALFMIEQYHKDKSLNPLDAKYEPIIQKVLTHIEHESKLRKAIAPFYEVKYLDTVWFRLAIERGKFRVSTPLFPSFVPYENLLVDLPKSKYPLNDSPAKDALNADISSRSSFVRPITPKTANQIQLNPAQTSDEKQKTRHVTQADIIARDYLHLRSEPTLQIALTLDYFKRNIEKLSEEANQRYIEANIFQPGLLLKALSKPEFLPQFDAFLKTGLKFFSLNGQHQHNSLLFLRLDFLVSHYMLLNKQPAGLARLKTIQNDLEKQLSLENKPEITYVLQQYLFLNLVARMEQGEQSKELMTRAYQAYNYINSHTNPLILEDKAHTILVDRTAAHFQSIIQKQPREQLTQTIKTTIQKIAKQPEQEIMISGDFPVFTVLNTKTNANYQFNALKGKMYEQGLARSGVPLAIQNHPLIKELGLENVKECLMTANEDYIVLPDEHQEVRLFCQKNVLTVQKFWTIEGNKVNYELQALSTDHEARQANQNLQPLATQLPPILKDGTMNLWCTVAPPYDGLVVQNNVPVYVIKYGMIKVLDEKGFETGEQLTKKETPLLNNMESKKFQLSSAKSAFSDSLIKLPRYNLSFEQRQGTLFNKETGEQVVDIPSPIHPSVAGIVLASKEQQHYMVPVARFYATEDNAQTSDFYPLKHDISGTIADARLEDHWQNSPPKKKPLWHYPNSERHVQFQLKNGEPIADSAADALYLAYIYMATNQTEKAWKTLEECTTRFGGLTGDPSELQFISWISNQMPHILPGERSAREQNDPIRSTPPYVACQLKASSLLCDYIAQNGPIHVTKTNSLSLDGTANALYGSLEQEALEQFQTSLPKTIYQSFTRLQTMNRHLEHTYTLSSLERKRLLNYYHQNNAPQGALGFEWLNLSLESLLEEQEALLAKQTADKSLTQADNERLKLIQSNLARLKPVTAKSSELEQIPLNLDFPEAKDCVIKKGHLKPATISNMDTWMHKLPGSTIITPLHIQPALNSLSSTMSDDEFIMNFPIFLSIATSKEVLQRKELYDFCSDTLIAKRHIPLKDQESNIPLLCNVLYRLLTPGNEHVFHNNTYKFIELITMLRYRHVNPLLVYQAKDVYKDILATPEQIMAKRTRPEHAPLKATGKELPSLLAQTKIEKHLDSRANGQLKSLIQEYNKLELDSDNELNELAKTLDEDLDKTFDIEEQAGIIRFKTEQKKRELAQDLIQNNSIMNALSKATAKAEPILKVKIEKSWQEALALANQGPEESKKAKQWAIEKKSKARPTLTQSDLLALYLKADFAYSVEKTGLSLNNAQRLHNAIHKALVHGIQHQSLKRAHSDLLKALATDDSSVAAQALDVLARTEIPGLNEPSIVILQHEEQVLLRKRQSSALRALLKTPEHDTRFNEIIEKIIMGGGKSKVILPILAEKKAQGDNLVVVEVPKALLATNHVDLNSTSQRLFGKRAYRFEFDRDSDCSAQRLEQIYNLFIEIMNTRSYLVTTGEAVQSLELKYLELLLSEEKPTEEWKQQVYWCDKITNLFRHHTDCIIDEVHLGLSLKKKLNYNFGTPKPIDSSLIKNVTALFSFIDMKIIKEAPSFDEYYDWTPFKTDLAKKLITDQNSPLKEFVTQSVLRYGAEAREELIAYLTNNATTMPASVLGADEETQAALGLFKQEINVRLPQTLSQILGKHYGASKRKDLNAIEKTLAIPYAGTNVPNERSRYQDELEAINKTIQMMLLKGISKAQLIERITEWEALAREELFNFPVSPESDQKPGIDDTPTAKGFMLLTQELGIRFSQLDSKNSEQMNQLHQHLQSNRPFMFDILREFSLRQITQDSGILSSDNFNHAAQYRSVQGISGTPPLNDNAYHQRLSYDKAPSLGTDGYIFEVIRNKNTAISSCDNEETYQFIRDVLSRSKTREDTRAFIDIRGAFTGVNNYEVAQQTARYIKAYPMHFSNPVKQVLYFNEDQILCAIDVNKPDQSIVLGTSDTNELNRLLDTAPEERFTLFDQIHTTGTDIKQFNKAHAIAFVDDKTGMQEFEQGAMRERELDLNQTIELVVPSRMEGITLDELGKQFKKNDKQAVTADAPAAAQGQMRNHIRRQFINLIQDLPSEDAEKKAALTQFFRPLFEDKPSLDLFALYGGINKKQAIAGILGHYKNQMQKLWMTRLKSASMPPFAEDIEKMSLELENIVIKAIPFCLAEYDASDKSFNAEVEIQKEVQKEVQIEMLTLNETYDPRQQATYSKDWPYYYKYATFFENPAHVKERSFRLNEICAKNGESPDIFSDNLYGSKNYAMTYSAQKECVDAFLKPVFLVWYQRHEGQIRAMIVTPQEAKELGARIWNVPDSWIATTQDTVVVGNQPSDITADPGYQELREQVRFFNGEFTSLTNQDTGLLWLNILPEVKLEFFEKNLLPYRPGSEAHIHQLKTALTQAKSEGFTYIAKHAFVDLTHFNWEELYPEILPAQSVEYQKLANAFLYVNEHWENKDIQIVELQQKFGLPMNSLMYIDAHVKQLNSLKKVIDTITTQTQTGLLSRDVPFLVLINNSINNSLSTITKPIESCIGMTLKDFYKSSNCEPLQHRGELMDSERLKEISAHSVRLLNLLSTYPALKDKNIFNRYFLNTADNAESEEELIALINTINPYKDLLNAIIKNPNFTQHLIMPILQISNELHSSVLLELTKASTTSEYIDKFMEQMNFDESVFLALIRKPFLTESQLLLLLKNAPYEDAFFHLANYETSSIKVQDAILADPRLSAGILERLLKTNVYSNAQLLKILEHDSTIKTLTILGILAQKNSDAQVLLKIMQHPAVNSTHLEHLFVHPAANPELRKQILRDNKLSVYSMERIVRCNELNDEELMLLINNPGIKEYRGRGIANAILEKGQLSQTVLLAMIHTFNKDEDFLSRIYLHSSFDDQACQTLLQSSNLTPYMLLPLTNNYITLSDDNVSLILKNPSACDNTIRAAILQKGNIKENHLSTILKDCQKQDLLENIYYHRAATPQVRKDVLQHPLLSPKVILNLMRYTNFSEDELFLILRHPACNEAIRNAMLQHSQLTEDHLLIILATCEIEITVERIHNHPAVNSRVTEQLLQHPLVPKAILSDILRSKTPTDHELMLLLSNPLIREGHFLHQELNAFPLNEEHFNELLTNHVNKESMNFVYNHPSATPEIRQRLLMHPKLSARYLLQYNILSNSELLILLNNTEAIDSTHLEDISRIPAIGYDVLLALITHNQTDEHVLYSAISHRTFDLNAASVILQRDRIPQFVLLQLACKILALNDNSAQWEHCMEQMINIGQRQNSSRELNKLFVDYFPKMSTKLSLKLLAFLGKPALERHSLTGIIQKATKEDFDSLIALPKKFSQEELTALSQKDLNS
uniref:DUF3638 domain-containing protein n=1 Tax=uncultured Legionella sp. TaxID=210934 RepID=UPI0026362EDD